MREGGREGGGREGGRKGGRYECGVLVSECLSSDRMDEQQYRMYMYMKHTITTY